MLSERHALIALNCVSQVGAAKARSLERAFGSVAAAAEVSAADIAAQCSEINDATALRISMALNGAVTEREETRAAGCNVQILTWADAAYPDSLRQSPSPPLALYCAGDIRLLSRTQVAIIGTRRASVYGLEQARRFGQRLAAGGIQVTSGLAEGVDSAAHEGALLAGKEAPAKTIAVIGAALDCVYPASRKPLARDIARAGGLVICEYPFGRHADAKTFPQRNRLVAALSKGILVIESPSNSGTMITVNQARGMGGRTLYALPGRADWPSFAGNHRLIREGEARLVTMPEHILDDFSVLDLREGGGVTGEEDGRAEVPPDLTKNELAVCEAAGADGASIDAICSRTGLPLATVLDLSIALQMRRRLRPLPGGLMRKNF